MPFLARARVSFPCYRVTREETLLTDTAAPRRLATIVALDVAGYSARTEADEAKTTAEVAALRAVIETIATRHAGRVFNTAGDGFMLEFGSSLSAVESAFELAEKCDPKVRVGVHLGDVVVQPNGDLLGHGVNVAARLMAQAEPGSALVSADVRRTIRGPLAERLQSRGTIKLNKMAEAVEVFALLPSAPVRGGLHGGVRDLWARRSSRPVKRAAFAAGALAVVVAAIGLLWFPPQPTLAPLVPEASVAVLPFENLSAEKDNAFFAAGIQDEILTQLTKIGSLKVISRTSTAHLVSRPTNLREIALKLGVANVLEGSVQREGDAVRVNVQLIKAATDRHLWAENYDRKLDNIFSVQSEIAIAIARALSARVTGAEKKELEGKLTGNSQAYDAYIRGMAFLRKSSGDDLRNAQEYLQRAVRLDPGFAAAWAQLSRAHSNLYFSQSDATPGRREAALKTLGEALRLQPNRLEVLVAEAFFQYRVERDYEGARKRFERLNGRWAGNAEILAALGYIARRQGRWDDSMAYLEQSLAVDPLYPSRRRLVADLLIARRDFANAMPLLNEAMNIWPDDLQFIERLAKVHQLRGELDQADAVLKGVTPKPGDELASTTAYQAVLRRRHDGTVELLEDLLKRDHLAGSPGRTSIELNLNLGNLKRLAGDTAGATIANNHALEELLEELKAQPDSSDILAYLAWAYCGLGDRTEAMKYADLAVERTPVSKDALAGAYFEDVRSRVWARLGDRERAIPAIERLLKTPSLPPLTVEILKLDPDFDLLRGDQRFEELLRGGGDSN